jgi:L-ribulose-5-phosphate 4-epimerase
MMIDALKEEVCRLNRELAKSGLVTLTWGNLSGIDRRQGIVVIKPSGVPYDQLEPKSMVAVDLEGKVVEGALKPSSDTATHLILYRAFEQIGGIVHTHSRYATMFAQARREIPCLGTTHADHFFGPVPVTRSLSESEVAADYEGNTGRVIVERFAGVVRISHHAGENASAVSGGADIPVCPVGGVFLGRQECLPHCGEKCALDPMAMPAVLVANHGPFAWGRDAADALQNVVALEAVAEMAIGTWLINPQAPLLESYLLEKHNHRKHGPAAYYGQQ